MPHSGGTSHFRTSISEKFVLTSAQGLLSGIAQWVGRHHVFLDREQHVAGVDVAKGGRVSAFELP